VEADYGGVRQRWLLVESEARAREVDVEEEGLRRRVARAEGEAEKALGRLLSRRFACEADARRALEEAGGGSWSGRGGAWDASSWPRTS
jgi:transposase